MHGQNHIKLVCSMFRALSVFLIVKWFRHIIIVFRHAVTQLLEALCYKPEGRGFDSRWCHWHNPSGRTIALELTQPLTELSTRTISWGGKCGQCVGLITLTPSCAGCREIWEPQPPGTLWAWRGLYRDCFIFFLIIVFIFLFSSHWRRQQEWPKHVGDYYVIKLHS